MISIVGVVLLFVCVFGGFVAHGGDMAPIIKAAPGELFIIGGAGVAGMVSGNSLSIFKAAMGGFGRVVKGPKYKKDDYVAIMAVISKLMKTLKAEGAVAMESHVENPEASAIFGEFPKMLKDHGLVALICDTIRLMVVSSGTLSPYAVEDVMTTSIKVHHHTELKAAEALASLSGALPALGIVACVLGVVKTMGAIDQPPPVLGALIGGALVGTFLGVFMAYGIFEPFAGRLKQIIDEDGEVLNMAKQIILGNMHGYPVPLIIEAGRVCISHHNQPTFGEIFDALRK
jgi:chemotaxis protein MotA